MKAAVYDIEVFKNLFVCSFIDINNEEIKTFVISPWQNQFIDFCDYFKQHEGLIGFNNVDYDYRVIQPFLLPDPYFEKLTGEEICDLIYRRSQEVLDENFKEFPRPIPIVAQRDLFRVNHYNNKSRMVSLKYLQINMGWRNVMESPFNFNKPVKEENIPLIIEYNVNDILSTLEFYHRCKDKIKLRTVLSKLYGVNMGNFSNNKIGETIFLKELAARTRRTEKSIILGRTPRKNIPIRDCLVPGIEFKTKEFKLVLDSFKKMIVTNTKKKKGDGDISAYVEGTKYDFGLGGLHALRAPGIYKNIYSADVVSYYTNLAISNRIFPNHLGEVFCDVYQTIYNKRKEYKKGTPENLAYKETLNCVYGSSNAPWSMFYDPRYTMSITINGQLLQAMLCEQLVLAQAAHVIMVNTDGIELDVIDQNKVDRICQAWQDTHKLPLEFGRYKQMAIRDANAYHAIKENGEIKQKNDFEVEKELHKDHSMRIVPMAVNDYFVKGIPIEKTIAECREISYFLIGKRARTGRLEYRTTEAGRLIRTKMPKNLRYYISRTGGSIVKVTKYTEKQKISKKITISPNQTSIFDVIDLNKPKKNADQRITSVHKGYRMTLFNLWVDKQFEKYDVDKQFYVREANKLINSVVQNQSTI